MKTHLSIEAFVLAGGKSSRMGSEKGLVLLHGKPMISYVLKSLEKAGLPVKIVAANPEYENFHVPLIRDLVPEKGPMGGLYTALRNSSADVVLLLSCDMPMIRVETLNELMAHASDTNIVVVSAEGKINPLFALYPKSIETSVEERLLSDQLKMQDLILENPHLELTAIAEKWPLSLRNINSPEELKELEDTWTD